MSNLRDALIRQCKRCLDGCYVRIEHCTRQLSSEQIWWRPGEGLNSIGNLILHLSGNVRQWIIAGLGDAEDRRDRPAEFNEDGPLPCDEILGQLRATLDEAGAVLDGLSEEQLLQSRRIQGSEVEGLEALFDCVPHFKGHAQEIVCLTRMQLGDGYKFYWQPSTPEEGAPAQ